ncbi:sigma factor [Rhodococcoides kroppenstedtii]|uniref:sigma factor n=1 Tax=Rhodococcoides kroppenstedtii TaxID=293050 RepID=UPI0036259D4E
MSPRVYGLALRVLRDPGYAEETVQEAFLQVWKQSGDYRPALGPVQSWVLPGPSAGMGRSALRRRITETAVPKSFTQ